MGIEDARHDLGRFAHHNLFSNRCLVLPADLASNIALEYDYNTSNSESDAFDLYPA